MRPLLLTLLALTAAAQSRFTPGLKPFVATDAPTIILRHVRVIDGTGAAPRDDQTLVIANGKIAAGPAPADAHVLDLLRRMIRIRAFEAKCAEAYTQEKIRGFLHLYDGEEAIAVGVIPLLEPRDRIVATYREHGHALVRGISMNAIMAEMYGKAAGCSHGRGGSMHLFDRNANFFGGNAIVGGGIPVAVGLALGAKISKDGSVAACFFGEGAAAEGEFHESLNLAALWKLPVLFVCENNLYGEFTRQDEHQLVTDIADRASSYGMPGVVVDGNDVLAVADITADAVARARRGDGPTLIEAKTYRHRGHFEGDMARYRPKDEVAYWMSRDPIDLFSAVLEKDFGATDDDLTALRGDVEKRLDDAAEWAREQPSPLPGDALDDVYVESHEGAALR